MTNFKPFANESQSITLKSKLGEVITIENGYEDIIFYGAMTITNDDPAVASLIEILEKINNSLTNNSDKHISNVNYSGFVFKNNYLYCDITIPKASPVESLEKLVMELKNIKTLNESTNNSKNKL